METEFEIKVLDIQVDSMINKVESLGAKKIAERKMKRYIYDLKPPCKDKWIRLRDNGVKKSLCIKEIESLDIDGTKEIEIEVSDFHKTWEILKKLGYKHRNYQENKRISYELNGVKIEFDFWPLIPPYIEIEGKSKAEVLKIVGLLGFSLDEITSISVLEVYKKYGIDLHEYKELMF